MKDKASVSHDEVMVTKLRKNQTFAAEYLRTAIEDTEEPHVLLLALEQIHARFIRRKVDACQHGKDKKETES